MSSVEDNFNRLYTELLEVLNAFSPIVEHKYAKGRWYEIKSKKDCIEIDLDRDVFLLTYTGSLSSQIGELAFKRTGISTYEVSKINIENGIEKG